MNEKETSQKQGTCDGCLLVSKRVIRMLVKKNSVLRRKTQIVLMYLHKERDFSHRKVDCTRVWRGSDKTTGRRRGRTKIRWESSRLYTPNSETYFGGSQKLYRRID